MRAVSEFAGQAAARMQRDARALMDALSVTILTREAERMVMEGWASPETVQEMSHFASQYLRRARRAEEEVEELKHELEQARVAGEEKDREIAQFRGALWVTERELDRAIGAEGGTRR